VSLEALQLCRDLGIAVVVLARDGTPSVSTVGYGVEDARLRRAQVTAADTDVGVGIVRRLLVAKLAGHGAIARDVLGHDRAAEIIAGFVADMEGAETVEALRIMEAQAAAAYFGAWPRVDVVRFVGTDAARVPTHWRRFDGRRSVLRAGNSNQRASQPVNAILSYCYRLAEIECRFALLTVGLDPGLGLGHADAPGRDALALDLMETSRPAVERYVLRLVAGHRFRKRDFVEASDGHVRLMAPLTHELAGTMPLWAEAVAAHAEAIAHTLADVVPGRTVKRTPLTAARRKSAARRVRSSRRRLPSPPLPFPVCAGCGVLLGRRGETWCPDCRPAVKVETIAAARVAGNVARDRRRAEQLPDPSQTADVRARRGASVGRRDAEALAWDAAHPGTVVDAAAFVPIREALDAVTVGAISRASGLSSGYASSVRRGGYVPHPRHWPALAILAGMPCPVDDTESPSAVGPSWWRTDVVPALAAVSTVEIGRVTGLSSGSCSKVRRGLQVPHPRHWPALAELAGVRLVPTTDSAPEDP
jgi:CRISPR-associated endonuclease Cas1